MINTVIESKSKTLSPEALIQEYTPLVKKIAHHLLLKLPASVQLDDLMQSGMIGLIEAAKNYDDSKGASFVTYAGIRIKGSMIDEVRKSDWAPRSVHRNARKIQEAVSQIEKNLKKSPKPQEIAQLLGISLNEYYQYAKESCDTKIYALEELTQQEESLHIRTTNPYPNPHERLVQDDFQDKLQLEIEKLPEKEKQVLALYYLAEMNLREVGDMLGVSESRISQIHAQAMSRLKGRVRQWNL